MKKELEWLKCFKANLEADYGRVDEERRDLIRWELVWINNRIAKVELVGVSNE